MWRVFRPSASDDDRGRFVIAPHHPDRLRRPQSSPTVADDRFHQALAWNVFRTLALVSPAFWLRRFQARMTGEPWVVPPQIASVRLWQHLSLPPVQRIDGDRPGIVADVVIETEHAVWTLLADSPGRQLLDGADAATLADAGRWFAGARAHYCGVLEWQAARGAPGAVLQARYRKSSESARLRSASRGPALPARVHWGGVRWPDLAALLRECRDAPSLPPIERALAGNAVDWLVRVGVEP